jgi:glycerol-3-phosphate acyltransferase PlsY
MNIVISFLDFFKGIVSKLLHELSKLKNSVTEDTKALLVVVAFIGFIAFSNYKEKHISESN